MTRKTWGHRLGRSAIAVIVCLAAYSALAVLPEAGLVLYGQVWDGTGALVTEGRFHAPFTPAAGGHLLTRRSALLARTCQSVGGLRDGSKGTYTYAIIAHDEEVAQCVCLDLGPCGLKKRKPFPLILGFEAEQNDSMRDAVFMKDEVAEVGVPC